MEGHGEVASTDDNDNGGSFLNGTLLYQVHDPRTRDEFQKLWNETSQDWVTLNDVKVWFNEAGNNEDGANGTQIPGKNGVDYTAGSLTIGYGAGGPTNQYGPFFGPELGFGFNLGLECNEKVLIVKTAWGGKCDSAR